MKLLNISGSPHVHSDESTQKIMWRVNLALVPALLVAIAYFGVNALIVALISVCSCVLFQWLIEKFILKVPTTVADGSAVVTGLLLAFNVPATVDMMWIVVIGALVVSPRCASAAWARTPSTPPSWAVSSCLSPSPCR